MYIANDPEEEEEEEEEADLIEDGNKKIVIPYFDFAKELIFIESRE